MKIAAAYVRVSTDDQLEYSPDSQIKIIREYAKKNDMVLPDEFIFTEQDGVSGRKAEKRPQFMRMIGIAKQSPRPFETILVWKFSRFARNREDSVVYKSMLRKQCGIDVISINEQLSDDKTSILIEALIEAMDEYYSINLAEEVKRGMTEKVTRGQIVTGPALGYQVINKEYIVHTDTAPIVQMVYEDFINGMGFRDIAVKLNNMGLRTRQNNLFENRTIEYILSNPVYIGKIRWNPTETTKRNYNHPDIMIIDGTHQPLITPEQWDITQQRLHKIKQMYAPYSRKETPSQYMLHGIVKCSNCGSTLCRATQSSIQCHSYTKGRCSVSHHCLIKKLDEQVLAITELAFTTGNFKLIERSISSERGKINLLIETEYAKLERIKEAYEKGIDTIDEYKQNKTRIQENIKHLQAKTPKQSKEEIKKAFIKKHSETLKQLKSDLSQSEKNKLIRTFVEKIVFDRKTDSVKIFYYA